MGSSTIETNLRHLRSALVQDLRGKAAIDTIIEDLDLTEGMPRTGAGPDAPLTKQGEILKHDLAQHLRENIGIRFELNSTTMDQVAITYTDSDPRLAADVVNRLMDNYVRQARNRLDALLFNAEDFFQKERDRYAAELYKLEQERMEFEVKYAGLDSRTTDDGMILRQNPATLQERLFALQDERDQVARELSSLRHKRDKLMEWVADQPDVVERKQYGMNPAVVELDEKIQAAEENLRIHTIEMQRTEYHPMVIKARDRLALLKAQRSELDEEAAVSSSTEPNTDKIQAEIEIREWEGEMVALEREHAKLVNDVEEFERFKRNLAIIRNQYEDLLLRAAEARQQRQFWQTNLDRTRITRKADVSQRGIRLVDWERAEPQPLPSKPDMLMVFGAAIAIGLSLGALMVLAAEFLDGSFRNVEHVTGTVKLPVMGVVDEIITPAELRRRWAVNWIAAPALGTVLLVVALGSAASVYLSLTNPERFQQLIENPRSEILSVVQR